MPIPLRADYDAARLRLAARESRDAGQTRRLLALAAIYDGATRSEAASVGGVTVQIVRDWVVKLNTGGPETLVDYKGPGPHVQRQSGWLSYCLIQKCSRRFAACLIRMLPRPHSTASVATNPSTSVGSPSSARPNTSACAISRRQGHVRQRGGNCLQVEVAAVHAASVAIWDGKTSTSAGVSSAMASVCM
jgi:hypothetical protein